MRASKLVTNIVIFLLIKCIRAKTECINLNLSLTQKIESLGFHRTINWLIRTSNVDPDFWINSACNVSLRLHVGRGMFVNPDQADDLKRLGKLNIWINGTVDVEAAAHQATGHIVYIFLTNSDVLKQFINIKLPIHLRYQRSLMGGTGKVILTKPNVLVHCPSETNSIICGKDRKVLAPLSADNFESLVVWKNITYEGYFDEMELLVPVGNLDHYAFVAIISCILGCAGCIYLLSLVSSQ